MPLATGKKRIPVVNYCTSVAHPRNWQFELAFPSVAVLTCYFGSTCLGISVEVSVSLLGTQLLSKGSSEIFPTNHDDLWASDYCWPSWDFHGPLTEGPFSSMAQLSVFYVAWLYAICQICRNPHFQKLYPVLLAESIDPIIQHHSKREKQLRIRDLIWKSRSRARSKQLKTSEVCRRLPKSLLSSDFVGVGGVCILIKAMVFFIYTHIKACHVCY